jgi:hypothetical protein
MRSEISGGGRALDGLRELGEAIARGSLNLTWQERSDWVGLAILGDMLERDGIAPLHSGESECDAGTRERLVGEPGAFLAERLLRVRAKDGSLQPLRANRAQKEYERRRGRRNIVLKARQMGVSTWVAGRMFLRTLLLPGTLTMQVAHNQRSAEEIFRIVRRFYQQLPEEMREGVWRCSQQNRRQLVFPLLDSEYRVESAADVNAGRGLTVQNLHCSELARWPRDAAATLAGLQAALSPTGELVLESTPMGAQGCFHELWSDAGNDMVKHFFPWWWEASYVGARVEALEQTDEERGLVEREGLSPEQIGYRRTLNSSFRKMARQEFAEDATACFLASGSCVFDSEVLEKRLAEVVAPYEKGEQGKLAIWFRPTAGKKYLIAVDAAGGGSEGDYAVAEVVELTLGLQCAEWRDKATVRQTAAVVARLAQMYGGALVVVERNNHGSGLLAHLEEKPVELYESRGMAGWLTTAVSRPAMIERLGATLAERPNTLHSRELLRECRTFVRQQDGRASAAAGCHDDCVIAMAIALSVRAELQEMGGARKR